MIRLISPNLSNGEPNITDIPHARLNIVVPRDNFEQHSDRDNWSVTSPEGVRYDGSVMLKIRGAGQRGAVSDDVPINSVGDGTTLRNASDTVYYWEDDEEVLFLRIFVRDDPIIELEQP